MNDFIYKFVKGNNGLVYAGGGFTNLGDANGDGIVSLTSTGVISSLTTGVSGGGVRAFALLPNGNVYVGGWFTLAGGVAGTLRIALWDSTLGVWDDLGGGIANGMVYDMVFDPVNNYLYVCGSFVNHGDANGDHIVRYDTETGVWTSLGTGADGDVYALIIGKDGLLYAGGTFSSMGGVANTASLARWTGTVWEPVGQGTDGNVESFAIGLDGSMYIGGDFSNVINASGINIPNTSLIARWNGVEFSSVGGGAVGTAIWSLQVTKDGILHIGGNFTSIGGLNIPDSAASWNGSVFIPIDINLPGDAIISHMLIDEEFNNTWVGYTTAGSAYSATVVVPNLGSSLAYPKVLFTGPGTLWQLKNYTTGKTIMFNLTLVDGERALLDLDPVHMSFTSSFRGNILSSILPGSALNFELLPGNNNISAYMYGATGANSTITMAWNGLFWSLNGATWK